MLVPVEMTDTVFGTKGGVGFKSRKGMLSLFSLGSHWTIGSLSSRVMWTPFYLTGNTGTPAQVIASILMNRERWMRPNEWEGDIDFRGQKIDDWNSDYDPT